MINERLLQERIAMARKKTRLTKAAAKIGGIAGTAIGRADRTARQVAKATDTAAKELHRLRKKVAALANDLQKTSKRLRRSLR
jgi:cell division septum initiation protein DivIVA